MPDMNDNLEALQRRIHELETELAERSAAPVPQDREASDVDGRTTRLLLDKAMRMASVGVWSIDLPSYEVTWSDEVFRIHELPVGDAPTIGEAAAFFAPEARVATEDAFQRLLTTGEPFDVELPLITAKNNRIWVRGLGDVEYGEDGAPMRLYGVFHEVTSQATLAGVRERSRAQAESATRATSEFLATMSHEIRTPLNGILGMAQVLEQSNLDSDQLGYVDAIQSSGSALLVLLNDILDLAKIEAGGLAVKRVAFNLDAVVRDSVDLLGAQQRSDAVDLRVDVDAELAGRWIGDPARIRQIIVNLFGNALKFTDEGSVELRARDAGDGWVHVEVEDTGLGIAPDAAEHLFEAFHQVDSSTTRRFGGTGLGLAICRRLVDHMGGRIGVESTPGSGSLFWFELPIERISGSALIGGEPVDDRAGTEAPRAVAASPTRVLVVEDNPVNQVVARKLVESLGNEVTLACNGDEGADAAFAAEFDIVLMDCQMPVLDGYEATRLIRRREAEAGRPHIPVIAMTANAMDGDRERCLEAGMDDYLPKPVDRAQLAAIIGRWVDRAPRTVA